MLLESRRIASRESIFETRLVRHDAQKASSRISIACNAIHILQSLARRFRSVILIAARDASSGFAYKRLHFIASSRRPCVGVGKNRATWQLERKIMHAEIPASSVVASTTGICIHLRRKQIPVSVTTTRTKSPVRSGTTCRPCGRSAYKRLHCTPLVSACETRRASCASLGASLLASRRKGRTQRASRLAPPSRTSPTRARRFARDLLSELSSQRGNSCAREWPKKAVPSLDAASDAYVYQIYGLVHICRLAATTCDARPTELFASLARRPARSRGASRARVRRCRSRRPCCATSPPRRRFARA